MHHFFVRFFVPIVLLAGAQGFVSARPLNTPSITLNGSNIDYGHWNVNITRGNAASGYRWENILAAYSGTGTTVSCKQLHDPTVSMTTRSCDDASFRYEVDAMASGSDGGKTWIALHQTVRLGDAGNSTSVAITGRSQIDIQCGKGGAGRSCDGSALVEATADPVTEAARKA